MTSAVANPPANVPANLHAETVTWVHHWDEHQFSFRVTRPASFRFTAGEFVMLGLMVDGKPLLRAYSMVSPTWDEEIEFLSIKVQDGPLTSRLQRIMPGDQILLGKKPTGTLVPDALLPGKRLFMLSTGTGLAPFMSIAREPDSYDRFDELIIVHSARRVVDLAYHDMLEARLADDPLVGDRSVNQFHYIPTVTREPFRNQGRIGDLIAAGRLHQGLSGAPHFDPETDRIMMCGSMAMIRDFAVRFEEMGFTEGAHSHPGHYVIERAFVG
ncbi:ferredoxin--NADP reductase [Sphingomonas sp. CJ99]